MNNNIDYEVCLNNDDLDFDKYIDFNQCLNNPVATVTIDMQNKYGKNITELFRAFGKTNDYKYIDGSYEGYGVTFYFDFTSVNFENVGYYYRVDRSKTNCIETINMEDGNIVSNVEIDYVISDMDWKDENTTITELNNNIAENLAYCLNNNNIRDTNFSVLRQNYYFIAKNNVLYVYACDNKCIDLSVTYFRYPTGRIGITNQSFVVDITNPNQNNMSVKYSTLTSGIKEISLGNPAAYNITYYKVALDRVIDSMTQQFKQLLPEVYKNLEKVAYTTISNGKIYISTDNTIVNRFWLGGNGVEVTPLYSNLDLSLTDQEIVETWSNATINILTLKNY